MLRFVSKSARSSERHQLRGFGYFKRTGPGFITGAADDDPALILSNSPAVGRQKGGVASNALVGIAFIVMSASAAWYLIELR